MLPERRLKENQILMMIPFMGNSRQGKTVVTWIIDFLGVEGGDCLHRDVREHFGIMEVFQIVEPDCGGGRTVVDICQYSSNCLN